MSKEHRGKNFAGEHRFLSENESSISSEGEHALLRVFEQELRSLKIGELDKRQLLDETNFDELQVFEILDYDKKGYLVAEDFLRYLQKNDDKNTTLMKAQKIFRRWDEDHDDKIIFEEFIYNIRPILMYQFHDKPYTYEITPAKWYHPETIKPLRKVYFKKGELAHKEEEALNLSNNLKYRNTSPTRVAPVREYSYNSMHNTNPCMLSPKVKFDQFWQTKNPVSYRGYYDWEMMHKSYGLTGPNRYNMEQLLIKEELESSKFQNS